MRVSKSSNKLLVLSMALMVLTALVVPFVGVANANHQGGRTTAVDLQPDADTAATGACNEFTVTAVGQGGAPAEGETVTITIAQQDQDTLQDNVIGFCDPDGTGTQATNAGGNRDLDDNPAAPNDQQDPAITPLQGTEAPARATGQCVTGPVDNDPNTPAAGTCTFGITSNEPGQTAVRACVTETDQFGVDQTICDQSTKTWVQGGAGAVENLDCEPETDQNPENTEHVITCTATNADGVAIADIQVQARVTAGPNEGTVLACGEANRNAQGELTGGGTVGNTDNDGQVECWYTDANDGDVGTDTIVAFVDQPAPQGGTARAGQPDAHEPQDTVTKNWFGAGRQIDCDPETAENPTGTQHTVTCVVTDREGQAVVGETVTFFEDGAGRFDSGNTRRTDQTGTVTVTTSTFGNEQGLQEITGTLNQGTNAPADAECEQAAGTPTGAQQGICQDQVVKNWVAGGGQPPQCNDGIDNDGDGDIDFPDDPGCTSLEDNTEAPNPGGGGPGPTRGPCAGFAFNSRTPKADGSGLVIVGSPDNDILIGTDGDDTICALGGDDQVDALEGQDQVVGNGGADEIDGGRGKDQLKGGRGRDIISGRGGNDVIAGGAGNDTLKGNKGIDSIRGEDGNDTIQGGSHQDTLLGGTGADVLRGWTGDDVIKGGRGHDIINGHRGFDICRGGAGNNVIRNCER